MIQLGNADKDIKFIRKLMKKDFIVMLDYRRNMLHKEEYLKVTGIDKQNTQDGLNLYRIRVEGLNGKRWYFDNTSAKYFYIKVYKNNIELSEQELKLLKVI